MAHERSQNASCGRRLPVRGGALCVLRAAGKRARLPLPHVSARGGRGVRAAGWRQEREFRLDKSRAGFFRSSNLAARGFCSACGTPLSFAYDMETARIYVTIGSLDAPDAAPIVMQYGVESRLSWVRFCEGVAEEETGAGSEEAAAFVARIESRQG
ncbi:MAG: GFA family protein [Terricaulis sp.]|nr:GFA family protein [Terricaulis sp.]